MPNCIEVSLPGCWPPSPKANLHSLQAVFVGKVTQFTELQAHDMIRDSSVQTKRAGLLVALDGHESSGRNSVAHQLVAELIEAGYDACYVAPDWRKIQTGKPLSTTLLGVNECFARLADTVRHAAAAENSVVVVDGHITSLMANLRRQDVSVDDLMRLANLQGAEVPDLAYTIYRDDSAVVGSLLASLPDASRQDKERWLLGEVAQTRNSYLSAAWALRQYYDRNGLVDHGWRAVKNVLGEDHVATEIFIEVLRAVPPHRETPSGRMCCVA